LRKLVEFKLEDGGSVYVEAEAPAGEITRGMRQGELAAEASKTLEAALASVQPAAVAIVERLRGLADTPDEIQVGFGIQLSAEFGAFVAKASGDANFSVTLHWKRERPSPVQQ
jgi:NTP-dependent ternary system trypsin peptidase co-occuring protein